MTRFEYLLSLALALLVLGGVVAWTHARSDERAMSCRPGASAPAVVMKGMSVYPRCGGAKSG